MLESPNVVEAESVCCFDGVLRQFIGTLNEGVRVGEPGQMQECGFEDLQRDRCLSSSPTKQP